MLGVSVRFKRDRFSLVRWQREEGCGIADVENFVFTRHVHIVRDISFDVKFLGIGGRLSVVSHQRWAVSGRCFMAFGVARLRERLVSQG